MTAQDLAGKRALVTGGASGIGLACAEFLAAQGLSVVTADLAAGADIRLDVTDSARVAEVADQHAVDVLVNSAGVIGPNKALTDVTDDECGRTQAGFRMVPPR